MTGVKGKACARCGAEVVSLICRYCGCAAEPPGGAEAEMKALEEFSGLLCGKDGAEQGKLLEYGYLPSAPAALIEAGVRCVPLIQDQWNAVSRGAVRRLEAIVVKLKIIPQDETTVRAVKEFEARVLAWREQGERDTRHGLMFFGVVLVLLVAAAAALWWRFS